MGLKNLTVAGAGQTTISGVISGTASSGVSTTPGLIGTYFQIGDGANQQSYIQPATSSNADWIGNQNPAATVQLTGPLDFPNISANGFEDSQGTTYYNFGNNNNSVESRWYGDITIPGTGTNPVPINFATTSDDGSMLYIDGAAVVANNNYQGPAQATGLVNLTPGLHTIDIEYYNGGGGASMDAQWDPTGGTNFVDIPNSAFVSIQAANGLTKIGTGALTLSNTNTYVGKTTINAGTLIVTANGAMGPATDPGVVVNTGGALAFAGGVNYTTAEPTSISGYGPAGNGAIENISGANSFAGPITLQGNATVGSDAGTLTLTGTVNLGAAGNLTAAGAGNLTFSGVISSTGTGHAQEQGLVGTYFQIGNGANQQGYIQPAVSSNPNWIGNQIPAATARLTGPLRLPEYLCQWLRGQPGHGLSQLWQQQ